MEEQASRADTSAAKFGLPPCLWIPIAAVSIEAIAKYVGEVEDAIVGSRVNAVLVRPFESTVVKHPDVGLWKHRDAQLFAARLHPNRQVWVHVDYTNYRKGYENLGMPPIPRGQFLDHVQNREAIRLRDYSHPYVRLCPVSRATNTSGGHNSGGEGMEKQYLMRRHLMATEARQTIEKAIHGSPIVYADPMDITKMLDIPPGTEILPGVRETMCLLYPSPSV